MTIRRPTSTALASKEYGPRECLRELRSCQGGAARALPASRRAMGPTTTEVERLTFLGVSTWSGSMGSVGRGDAVSGWWWDERGGQGPAGGDPGAGRGAVPGVQADVADRV